MSKPARRDVDIAGEVLGQGRPLFSGLYWNKKFKKALERAEIKSGRRYHFRNTFGVHHILAGNSPFILQRMMGHADISATMPYATLTDQDVKAHAGNINL